MPYFLVIPLLFNVFIFNVCLGQEIYPKDYFRSPLDIPINLSGNFGELRNNHFHSGLDIKTDGVEGKKVYAVADGFVSRIKVSPFGYGKALYVTHPNGYVSVYAHLKNYNQTIQKYLKNAQYLNETFEIEIFPNMDELVIKKGDIIGNSGNSGGSGGPHLHFEIREENTEIPVNPMFFGFGLIDNIKPTIREITIYPTDNTGLINNSNFPKKIPVVNKNGVNNLNIDIPIFLSGNVGFGVKAYDQINGSNNKIGNYSIELIIDEECVFLSEINKFSFDETRYINCHIDYAEYKRNKSHTEKCFIAPNNKLGIYKTCKNRGIYTFNDDLNHTVKMVISDFHGNKSEVQFIVKGKSSPPLKENDKISPKFVKIFKYNLDNSFENAKIQLHLPSGSLYDDINLEYNVSPSSSKTISDIYQIHNENVPVHSTYSLAIKIDSLPIYLKRKALIANIDSKGGYLALGGDIRNEFLYVNPKVLGSFAIMLDTIAPEITPINITQGGNMNKASSLKIKITDNLSGVKSYKGTIDGKWILMEYDAKNNLLFHEFEKELSQGRHIFKLEVKDNRGNVSFFEREFIR